MTQPVKLGSLCLLTWLVFAQFGAAAYGGPYLPLVGPPPVRIRLDPNPARAEGVDPALVVPSARSETNAAAKLGATNSAAFSDIAVTPPAVQPAKSPEQSLSDTLATPMVPMPTPDLMGITPQILATYFPPPRGSNGVAVAQFPVTFVPPLPPDHSSHAEYILK